MILFGYLSMTLFHVQTESYDIEMPVFHTQGWFWNGPNSEWPVLDLIILDIIQIWGTVNIINIINEGFLDNQ